MIPPRAETKVSITVHGGGFFSIGKGQHLTWLQVVLDEAHECKHHRLGPSDLHDQCARALNPAIALFDAGFQHEVGQGHVDVVLNQCHLEDAKAATRFGTRDDQNKAHEEVSETMAPPMPVRTGCRWHGSIIWP